MFHEKFSYDVYDENLSRIEGSKIDEKKYNEFLNLHHFRLEKEWSTKYNTSILYGKQFKFNHYYIFFMERGV